MPTGSSLVEVLVALTLLGVGMVGVGTATVAAARLADRAGLEMRLNREAWNVLDSLVQVPDPDPGRHTAAGVTLAWTVEPAVGGGWIAMEAASTGAASTRLRFRVRHLAPPPVLGR